MGWELRAGSALDATGRRARRHLLAASSRLNQEVEPSPLLETAICTAAMPKVTGQGIGQTSGSMARPDDVQQRRDDGPRPGTRFRAGVHTCLG